jgi:cation diffusion facilitator family transporter
LEKGKENLRVQQWVVVIAIVLFSLKIVAYFLTRSVAILTDALESTVNVVAGFIGWYSLYIAAKPSDEDHPYGHGKAEFLSAAIEGILIIIAALFIIYEAIYHLIYPGQLHKLDYGILLIGISALINYLMGYIAIKKGKQNNSLALEASGRHLQSDTYSTLAIIAGLLLIYFTNIQQIDSIAAILISFILIFVGYRITRRSIAGIMDEADEKILVQMVALLNRNRRPNWIDIHNFRVIKFGSVLHVDCHLTVPWYVTVKEAHAEIDVLIALIVNEFGEAMEFFVHEDGCIESSCPICSKKDCPVRQHPLEKRIEWTLGNIIPNKKHRLGEKE